MGEARRRGTLTERIEQSKSAAERITLGLSWLARSNDHLRDIKRLKKIHAPKSYIAAARKKVDECRAEAQHLMAGLDPPANPIIRNRAKKREPQPGDIKKLVAPGGKFAVATTVD